MAKSKKEGIMKRGFKASVRYLTYAVIAITVMRVALRNSPRWLILATGMIYNTLSVVTQRLPSVILRETAKSILWRPVGLFLLIFSSAFSLTYISQYSARLFERAKDWAKGKSFKEMLKSTLANIFLKSPTISTTSINSYVVSVLLFPYRLITAAISLAFRNKIMAGITVASIFIVPIAALLLGDPATLAFTVNTSFRATYSMITFPAVLYRGLIDTTNKGILTTIPQRITETLSSNFSFSSLIAVMYSVFSAALVSACSLFIGYKRGRRVANYLADIEEVKAEASSAVSKTSTSTPTSTFIPGVDSIAGAGAGAKAAKPTDEDGGSTTAPPLKTGVASKKPE